MWIVMPAVPAFAGDVKSDGANGTRALMQHQYHSISRGGHSILEKLREAGIQDSSQYIGFYNLRNFDRINTSQTMVDAEKRAGCSYQEAREGLDLQLEVVECDKEKEGAKKLSRYKKYQRAAGEVKDKTLDTVSPVYMSDSMHMSDINWDGDGEGEMKAFVSEELYVHSKVLIADDRVVICGSANLNDRSQLGTHDSEIAVVIEDPTPVKSVMNGRPYKASKFATSLRRQLFRKHLGLLPNQKWDHPDENWHPVDESGNCYDWGSSSDLQVRDPLDASFERLWTTTAQTNTEVFRRAFHAVPDDKVRTWADYDDFFGSRFAAPGGKASSRRKKSRGGKLRGKTEYGHIVKDEFPGGIDEVKTWLSRVRGTLVDMPLNFLADVEAMTSQGWAMNGLTEELYT